MALLTAVISACRPDAPHAPMEVASFTRLNSASVERLRLVKVDSIILGTAREGVSAITDFEEHDGELYVLDAMSKSVRVFDRSGALKRVIGRAGHGPGEFTDPVSMAFVGGRMYVADPHAGKRLSTFAPGGRFERETELNVPTVPVSLAEAGDRIATLGILVSGDPARQQWATMAVSTPDGRNVGRGCVLDPRYVESGRRDGMIAHFDFGSVAARGNRLYCVQGISPVVQVMDRAGNPVGQIRVAPPFYLAPHDQKLTMNQKAIFDFMAGFTAHAGFFPVDGGFVSAYSRFDRAQGEVRFHLFVCHGERRPRCGTVENVRRPVYVPSLDTVYLEEEAQPNAPMQVGIYRVEPVA
ncbi:MAG TPA: 6-bladed beta-propeller [Longimicrobium sp.]|nr:6-bladed beta-propeller [Longimicrobium sp.]